MVKTVSMLIIIPWVAQIFNIFNTHACQVKNVSKKFSYIFSVSREFSFTWRRHLCAVIILSLLHLLWHGTSIHLVIHENWNFWFGNQIKCLFWKWVIFDVIGIFNRCHLSSFQNNDRTCFCETRWSRIESLSREWYICRHLPFKCRHIEVCYTRILFERYYWCWK